MATDNLLERLQAKQNHYRMSLRALALELGITQPYLSMLIAGKRRVTPEVERKHRRVPPAQPFGDPGIYSAKLRSQEHS